MKPSMTVDQRVVNSIQESLSVKQAILQSRELIETVAAVGAALAGALRGGRKIFFFGNGGSAADAQHLAAELVGRFERERRALPAIALGTNTSTLTAIGNDYSYEAVFARQLEALSSPGDVAVGISTSGRSPNVISAVRAGRKAGVITVGMTGLRGDELAASADYCVRVPSDKTPRIQEAHILIGHILCEIVEEELFDGSSFCMEKEISK
jgi:D-sedoheptulose 7-phosphate isomerase